MFNKLAKQINRSVREKGFWQSMHRAIVLNVNVDQKGDMLHTENSKAIKDAFIAQKIALIQSELSEALEAMRKGDYTADGYGVGKKDSFADELADTIIRILDLCGELNIDIDAQMAFKMAFNSQREAKHGKEF